MPDDHEQSPASRGQGAPGLLRRTLTASVPLWLLLACVLFLAVVGGIAFLVQAASATHLGPAVGASQHVEVTMTLCNRDVDSKGINPRAAELDLQSLLRDKGARAANVVVSRIDCPPKQGAPG